jgi:Flp pilus assembly pilin Flp
MISTDLVLPARDILKRLRADRHAVTALEYGIIAGVLGLVLIAIFRRFGSTLSTLFSTISSSV